MDQFAFKHSMGITLPHLSPSTINSFITSRFQFYQSKVKGKPFSGNAFTARGTAVEHGINTWIEKGVANIKDVLDKFDEEIEKSVFNQDHDKVMEVRSGLKGLFDCALEFYMEEFQIDKAKTQQKVSIRIEGVQREVLGYMDYLQKARVRDCKVVSKTPSSLSQSYILQGSFYRKATGLPVVFDFFVDNKKPVHKSILLTDDEYIFGLSYLTKAAQVLEELEECDNPCRIMELMSFPNLDDMYNREDKIEAATIWGITLK